MANETGPRNPGKGPLPDATHRASGIWISHKAGPPLPAVELSVSCESSNLLPSYIYTIMILRIFYTPDYGQFHKFQVSE
jgi:hypothetical protein